MTLLFNWLLACLWSICYAVAPGEKLRALAAACAWTHALLALVSFVRV